MTAHWTPAVKLIGEQELEALRREWRRNHPLPEPDGRTVEQETRLPSDYADRNPQLKPYEGERKR